MIIKTPKNDLIYKKKKIVIILLKKNSNKNF